MKKLLGVEEMSYILIVMVVHKRINLSKLVNMYS